MTFTVLTAGLLTGCLPESDRKVHDDTADSSFQSVTVFAKYPQYLKREEPEQEVCGMLSRVDIRTGPNTREHPIRLRTDQGEWGVYSEGIPQSQFDALIDRPLCLIGKWIDQRDLGAPIEVWIGKIETSAHADE